MKYCQIIDNLIIFTFKIFMGEERVRDREREREDPRESFAEIWRRIQRKNLFNGFSVLDSGRREK